MSIIIVIAVHFSFDIFLKNFHIILLNWDSKSRHKLNNYLTKGACAIVNVNINDVIGKGKFDYTFQPIGSYLMISGCKFNNEGNYFSWQMLKFTIKERHHKTGHVYHWPDNTILKTSRSQNHFAKIFTMKYMKSWGFFQIIFFFKKKMAFLIFYESMVQTFKVIFLFR